MPSANRSEPPKRQPSSIASLALVGLVIPLALLTSLCGCGTSVRVHTTTATSHAPVSTAVLPPMRSDAPTVSEDVFARDETQAQPYFVSVQERSRSAYCGRDRTRQHATVMVELPSGGEFGNPRHVGTATFGQSVEVCPYGFHGDRPLTLEWVSGGRALRQSYPAGQLLSERTWQVLLDSRFASGRQTITARQGDVTRTAILTLSRPRTPTLGSSARFEAPAGDVVSVLVAGMAPHRSVPVDLYVVPNEGGGNAAPQYRTTLELKADARGLAETNYPSRLSDHGQYALSLRPLHEGEEGQTILITLDEVAQSFPEPVGLAAGERPSGVFETHTAPPPGVAAQIGYFVGAGGSSCYSQLHATQPVIAFGRVLPRVSVVNTSPSAAAPQIGDLFFICAEHFPATVSRITVTRPDGKRETWPLQGGPSMSIYDRTLLQTTEIGTYMATAVQGGITRSAHYRVSYPTEPGDTMVEEHGLPPELLVVGLPAHQRYHVLVYETPGGGAGGPHEQARYNGSIERQADAHGVDTVPFSLSPHDPKACFVMRVQYAEHIVVDKEEGQTTLCLPRRITG